MSDRYQQLDDTKMEENVPSRRSSVIPVRMKTAAHVVKAKVHKYTCFKYFQKKTYRALAVVLAHISVGVMFFCFFPGEEWSFIDSLYICVGSGYTDGS